MRINELSFPHSEQPSKAAIIQLPSQVTILALSSGRTVHNSLIANSSPAACILQPERQYWCLFIQNLNLNSRIPKEEEGILI